MVMAPIPYTVCPKIYLSLHFPIAIKYCKFCFGQHEFNPDAMNPVAWTQEKFKMWNNNYGVGCIRIPEAWLMNIIGQIPTGWIF